MDESIFKGKIDLDEARKYDPLVGKKEEEDGN
jgi:hypothetical protein